MSALEPIPDPRDSLVVFLPAGEDLDLDDGLEEKPSKVASPSRALPRILAGPKFCNGIRHNGEGYCHRPAGWRTPHFGIGRCILHGGMAPSSMKAAEPFMRDREHAALGRPMGTTDPGVALRTVQAVADGMVKELGLMLAKLKDPTTVDHLGDLQRHALEVQLLAWVGASAQIAAAITKLGLDAREVAFHEAQISELSGLMVAVLEDPELGLSHPARQQARQVLLRHLRRLKGSDATVDVPGREIGP